MNQTENPVMGTIAREQMVKGPVIRKALKLSVRRFAALRRDMGIKGHYAYLSKVRQHLYDHPDMPTYQPKAHPRSRSNLRAASGRSSGKR